MTDNRPTTSELLAVMSSRVLEDGQTIFAGVKPLKRLFNSFNNIVLGYRTINI